MEFRHGVIWLCQVLRLAAVRFEMAGIGSHGFILPSASFLQGFVEMGAVALLALGDGRNLSVLSINLSINEIAGGCDKFIHETLFVFTARGLGTAWGGGSHRRI